MSSTWWNRRNQFEKLLLVLLLIFLIICLALALAIIAINKSSEKQVGENIIAKTQESITLNGNSSLCLTPGCIKIAALYLQNANFSANPCEDFYNFACGQFEANIVVPDQKSWMTALQSVDDILNYQIKAMLESPSDKMEPNVFKKMRNFYSACMNKSAIYILKEKPLKELLVNLGGWPAIDGLLWKADNFEWTKLIYALRKIGVKHDLLLDFSVLPDMENSSKYTPLIDKPRLGMPGRAYYLPRLNDTHVQKYFNFMVDTAVLLGAARKSAAVDLFNSLNFEFDLAKIKLPQEKIDNFTNLHNKMTLRKLNNIAPFINWVEYVSAMLMEKINEDQVVIVASTSYLGRLAKLLADTDKRTIANYLMWRVAESVLCRLDDRFQSIRLEYMATISGQSSSNSRWINCVDASYEGFYIAIGAMYVRKYMDKNAKDMMTIMALDIKREFISILKKVDWMDPITLHRALHKARAIDEMIAYPLELLNDTILDHHYQNVTVEINDYFGSALQLEKRYVDYQYGKLSQTLKKSDEWKDIGVAVGNAYYSFLRNSITVPAGILQGVFFGSDRPKYVNYGAIGSVIGHEIAHGFDDIGKQFDADGNLENWWEAETEMKFHNKTKCVIDQYSQYKINGINTLDENIADNVGAKDAYQAYHKWVETNGEENLLPGLNLTQNQAFWLSLANVYCGRVSLEVVMLNILTGAHSPQKFRVNGVVSNSPQFANDFNCPVGSPMNPPHKCVMW